MTFIATIAVALRIISKVSIGSKIRSDDWWILGALMFLGAGLGILTCGALRGFEDTFFLGQALIIGSIFYPVVTSFIRLSILCLYSNLFATAQIRRGCFWVGILCILWCAVVIPTTAVVCLPVAPDRRLWGTLVTGYCFNYDAFALAMGIVETVIDAIIIILPLKLIMNLQLVQRDRVILICMFLVGIFIIFTGILRAKYSYIPNSIHVDEYGVELWSFIHCGTAVLCACLPTYRPLGRVFTTCLSQRYGIEIKSSKYQQSKTKSIALEGYKGNTYNELRDYRPDYINLTTINGESSAQLRHASSQEESIPGNTIAIERTIEVV
ncbi:hypothetical protein EAF04_000292 [Stromatinia cepivora]|nr:hypothetical protein EAF04_000292 [Stromatinia cepivora]